MPSQNKPDFKATSEDGSLWTLPYLTVVADMDAHEGPADDEKWPRPITYEMAHQWVSDNADTIQGWTLLTVEKPRPENLIVSRTP
jgi:hypothetical protein